MIDWDTIRELGDEGLLTGEQVGSLSTLAQTGERINRHFYCGYCDTNLWTGADHADDCPVVILEAITAEATAGNSE